MDERRDYSPDHFDSLAVAGLILIVTSPVLGVIQMLTDDWTIVVCFCALVIAASVMHAIVRWANRRDDPRFAKRPPDAP